MLFLRRHPAPLKVSKMRYYLPLIIRMTRRHDSHNIVFQIQYYLRPLHALYLSPILVMWGFVFLHQCFGAQYLHKKYWTYVEHADYKL